MKRIHTEPHDHAAEGDERIRTAVCAPGADSAYEFLCWLLRDEPRIENLDPERVRVHVHVDGESYWRISGTDLRALLEARKFVLAARGVPS